jgi:enamine deaminase RidA (YjgF/YER057c/UK114 family)
MAGGVQTSRNGKDQKMGDRQVAARFLSPDTMPKPYGYSQVVEVSGGRTVYLAGQVPLDTDNKLVGEGDFRAQVRQTFENVRHGLDAVGMTFDNVVKIHFYLTNIADLPLLREIRDDFVNTSQPPASTSVEVAALFQPDVLFEMDVIAVG